MNVGQLVAIGFAVFVILALVLIFIIRKPKKLKTQNYMSKWKELQGNLRDPESWALALSSADHMLNTALKKRKLKGKSMGERLVSAQRLFSDNDSVWFAHNLAKKVIADENIKLKESDVRDALLGFRDALKDIGALQISTKDTAVKSAGRK